MNICLKSLLPSIILVRCFTTTLVLCFVYISTSQQCSFLIYQQLTSGSLHSCQHSSDQQKCKRHKVTPHHSTFSFTLFCNDVHFQMQLNSSSEAAHCHSFCTWSSCAPFVKVDNPHCHTSIALWALPVLHHLLHCKVQCPGGASFFQVPPLMWSH